MELDAGVGEILNKLHQLKIERDTFVFFSSDNGAATYAFTEGLLFLFSASSIIFTGYLTSCISRLSQSDVDVMRVSCFN